VMWRDCGEGLEERLADLHGRVHRRAYRAKPSRRVWIPKGQGRQQRPSGIAAREDKIVQYAAVQVLNQIWDENYVEFSFGFWPGRSQHNGLNTLYTGIIARKVNYIVDLARDLLRQSGSFAQAVHKLAESCAISPRQSYRYLHQAERLKGPAPVVTAKIPFTVKLSEDLVKRLRRYVKRSRSTLSEGVSQAVTAWLDRGRGRG
jgi:hypothetical protein